ncbi:MAG: phenylalanine--tRNA ligase subunit beta, partial [Bacteroidia bacterium]|nr:phenylalanine--tRNA ligase subunit beta [Bacteroidia bacterium]
DDYTEKKSLDIFLSGNSGHQRWNNKPEYISFFNIKSTTEMILSRLGFDPDSLPKGESTRKYFAESVTWSIKNLMLAESGRISKEYLAKFDIGQDVYYAHFEWDLLLDVIKDHTVSYNELPKYPWVRRDLALLIDKSVRFGQIRDIAFKTEKHILQTVDLFDVYESDSLGDNKKSYAVSFILRDDLKTLTDKNIEKVMNSLVTAFEKELNARIR